MNFRKIPLFRQLLISVTSFSFGVCLIAEDDDLILLDQESVIQKTLENYFSIQIDKFEVSKAKADVLGSMGEYDPRLLATGIVGESGASRSLTGIKEGYSDISMSLGGALSTGTEYEVEISSSDFASSEDFLEIDRFVTNVASVSISQPLYRDRGGSEARNRIRIARSDYDLSKQAFAQLVIDAVTESQYAFLDTYTAEQILKALEENRDLAKLLLEDNKRRIDIGTMAPSDIFQAEAEVAARESLVYAAELRLGDLTNSVRRFISGQTEHVLDTDFSLRSPPEVKRILVAVEVDIEVALEMRPDYLQALAYRDRARWNWELNKSKAKPRVDLIGGIDYSKTATKYSNGWKNASRDDTAIFLGVGVELPVRNRFASAERIKAEFARKQMELSIADLEQFVYLEVDNAARRIDSGWSRLRSAQTGLSVAEESLKAEQRKLQSGNSSSFIVLRLQSDLASARIRELNAINDYRKAVIDYERQLGITLEKNDIEVPQYD